MPCVHEFCILPDDPQPEEKFEYPPERRPNRAVVDDELLNEWAGRHQGALWAIPVYFESLRRPEKGLAWYGITLIPPESAPLFRDLLDRPELAELAALLKRAAETNKYIIHYGI